ncbi:Protein HGH1 C-terminal,Armadillo-type fold,Armadillo-like helical,Protein HGH1 N-terminal [Cinara cedri]|uniref:Protein HGH1 homolog n=1 Tax=Cinara cedri TaxID=506608 RepID=A0A5E4N2N8_9HEMI|nr:Protein HGH1 C-terminal,Armadillo-type fold,Armadillo-like helical,Protein HGH1 N-terminal [Cinara cedri]
MDSEISNQLLLVMIRALALDNLHELKEEVLQHLLKITGGNYEENEVINENIDEFLKGLFNILKNDSSNCKTACLCLVNVSTKENGLNKIMSYINSDNSSNCLLQYIDKETPEIANAVLMLLCNLTREKNHANKLYEAFLHNTLILESLMKLFITPDVKYEANYNYISYLLSNLCQLHEFRMWLMDSGNFEKLLSFINHENSLRKAGVIMLIKNCCFELEKHEWLLNEDLDLLPRLLLPLAGPEQFDEEDNEKLPLDLQYLSDDKERESDPNLRLALLQALTQLSAKRCCREIIRDQGTYLILRELHKWEPNMEVKLACENLVDILIKTEDEIGTENFHDLNVPEDLINKFEKMDEAYLN